MTWRSGRASRSATSAPTRTGACSPRPAATAASAGTARRTWRGLQLIAGLLERGFSLGNIAELLDGWSDGRNLGDLLGLGRQITGPFTDEVPDAGSAAEISERYGLPLDDLRQRAMRSCSA